MTELGLTAPAIHLSGRPASQIATGRAGQDQLPIDDRVAVKPIRFREIGFERSQRIVSPEPYAGTVARALLHIEMAEERVATTR
jgi:hypothetical protein